MAELSKQSDGQNNTNRSSEYHVASFVAHAMPQAIERIKTIIAKHQGTEVHADSPEGKIVFTVEATHQRDIAKIIDQIRIHDELYSLSPVYHQFLTEPDTLKTSKVS